jgi:hypothetical protein
MPGGPGPRLEDARLTPCRGRWEGRHDGTRTTSAMTSELIVKLAPAAEPDRIRTHANDLGVELERLHPGTDDPELASYLVARVDPEGARGVAERLMRFDGVESAYVKPGGAPPERSSDGVTP